MYPYEKIIVCQCRLWYCSSAIDFPTQTLLHNHRKRSNADPHQTQILVLSTMPFSTNLALQQCLSVCSYPSWWTHIMQKCRWCGRHGTNRPKWWTSMISATRAWQRDSCWSQKIHGFCVCWVSHRQWEALHTPPAKHLRLTKQCGLRFPLARLKTALPAITGSCAGPSCARVKQSSAPFLLPHSYLQLAMMNHVVSLDSGSLWGRIHLAFEYWAWYLACYVNCRLLSWLVLRKACAQVGSPYDQTRSAQICQERGYDLGTQHEVRLW